jgi:hypothetical protein
VNEQVAEYGSFKKLIVFINNGDMQLEDMTHADAILTYTNHNANNNRYAHA